VAIACASSARPIEQRPVEEAGAAGESANSAAGSDSEQGGAGEPENGGASGRMDAVDVAEAGSDGGSFPAQSEAAAKRAPSGTRLCEVDLDCDELSCTSSTGRLDRACLARCESAADCKRSEGCFGQSSIEKSCFHSCQDSYTECAYQFDCVDYYRTNVYLCIPTEWARNWPPAPSPDP
jgi:hypothetical protein